jgi:phytoene synthase
LTAIDRATSTSVEAAYSVCCQIARREAKNFYYAFRVLPRHKRDAMCAIYAFMRRADDIADDESLSIEDRRATMAAWLAGWRVSTVEDSDPVFVAVRDTQQQFGIPNQLLEQLVSGTTMDLEESLPGVLSVVEASAEQTESPGRTIQVYDRFDDLYRYCYLVASVVGLVCIRIFGYTDPRAELLAEKTGIAFQLTNILRDIKEDVARGRIYIPLEDLALCDIPVEQVALTATGSMRPQALTRIVSFEVDRATAYYRAAEDLIPLLDRDSRAAMWVLVTIYRGILRRIALRRFDVFTSRIRISTPEKLFILSQGMARSLFNRAFA